MHISLIEDLLKPGAYRFLPEEIELKQTHLSYLLFTPKYVYKIKKPVDFGFVDFTTLDKRLYYCQREVELNCRLCPSIYLDVVKITREGKEFKLEGKGAATEYAVKMKRLPAAGMLSNLLANNTVSEAMMGALAEKIADFHGRALTSPEIAAYGDISVIRQNTDENFAQIAPFINRTIDKAQYDMLVEYTREFQQQKLTNFIRRASHDHIRDCHGDIHAENICVDEDIFIYDCIEFNDRFRYSDTIADIAFLIMDLEFNGYMRHAKILRDAYQQVSHDDGLETLLDFYKVYRACVRGKVDSLKMDEPEVPESERLEAAEMARNYFSLACSYAEGSRPLFMIVRGLSGTGKSTLARAIAERTGAKVLSSDRIRKELAGIAPETPCPEDFEKGIYSREMTARTYAMILDRAAGMLSQGDSVILDATFLDKGSREAAETVGARTGCPPVFIECVCPEGTVMRRLRNRMKEPGISDGRKDIYFMQKQLFEPTLAEGRRIITVDTSAPLPRVMQSVFKRFWTIAASGQTSGLTAKSLV